MAGTPPLNKMSQSKVKSPVWHAKELKATKKLVKSGQAKFSDWEEAKVRIRRKAAMLT
jgi:hypothetical protein